MQSNKLDHKVEPTASARLRVRKACQRCKLKKGKCDGSHPCEKCQEADEICVYSSAKKRNENRPRPRGYVELLEEQQKRMASGLRRMYKHLREMQLWKGDPLIETDGGLSILDILAALDRVEQPTDQESGSAATDDETPSSKNDDVFNPIAAIRPDDDDDDGNMDITGLGFELQDQEISQEIETFNLIDWDMATIFTPPPTNADFQDTEILMWDSTESMGVRSVTEYAAEMVKKQAQQAKLEVLPASACLPTATRCFSEDF